MLETIVKKGKSGKKKISQISGRETEGIPKIGVRRVSGTSGVVKGGSNPGSVPLRTPVALRLDRGTTMSQLQLEISNPRSAMPEGMPGAVKR